MHSAFSGAVPYRYLFLFLLPRGTSNGMDRLKLTLVTCNKKYLARLVSLTSGSIFTVTTSNRFPYEYKSADLQRLFSFQFCRSLSDFYGRLFFAKCRNRFSDCQSVAIESSLHFHFMLHGRRSAAFQLHRETFALLYFASERQPNHRSD